MEAPKIIQLQQLHAHPKNPRISIRQDVVDGIAESLLNEGFKPEHALLVRPLEDGYQILSGHHRRTAAQKAGLSEVPCWVREMDDDAAYMALVTSNTQGELTSLEIGLHALERVNKGKHGGGLSGYAKLLGKTNSSITEYRYAAEVYKAIFHTCEKLDIISSKHRHLSEIHAADKRLWSILAAALLRFDWSVKDTHYWVEQVNGFFKDGDYAVPEEWRFFLPLEKVAEKYLTTKEFAASTVAQLCEQVRITEETIRGFNIDKGSAIEEYREWLISEPRPWDVRILKKHHEELKNRLESEERAAAYSLGDWREHLDKLADGSVRLLLTDPPYGMAYQSGYKLDHREDKKHDPIANDTSEEAIREVSECVKSCLPKLQDDAHILCFCHWSNECEMRKALEGNGLKIRGSLIWEKNNTGMGDLKGAFAPKHERVIHAVKGSPILYERKPDVLHADRCDSKNHPTEKPVALLSELIEATTVRGDIVLDPFAGVASTLVAAKNLERGYFGCEVELKYHEMGVLRLQ
ncbi:hypothetical protein FACS1894216_01070 [Synergistales bacterium]|nr:hypothetical protein FACS1894216_01070 [Synergistales bacterium]